MFHRFVNERQANYLINLQRSLRIRTDSFIPLSYNALMIIKPNANSISRMIENDIEVKKIIDSHLWYDFHDEILYASIRYNKVKYLNIILDKFCAQSLDIDINNLCKNISISEDVSDVALQILIGAESINKSLILINLIKNNASLSLIDILRDEITSVVWYYIIPTNNKQYLEYFNSITPITNSYICKNAIFRNFSYVYFEVWINRQYYEYDVTFSDVEMYMLLYLDCEQRSKDDETRIIKFLEIYNRNNSIKLCSAVLLCYLAIIAPTLAEYLSTYSIIHHDIPYTVRCANNKVIFLLAKSIIQTMKKNKISFTLPNIIKTMVM